MRVDTTGGQSRGTTSLVVTGGGCLPPLAIIPLLVQNTLCRLMLGGERLPALAIVPHACATLTADYIPVISHNLAHCPLETQACVRGWGPQPVVKHIAGHLAGPGACLHPMHAWCRQAG